MIIVSKSKVTDKTNSKERPCKYSDVPKDELGWVYNLIYMPIPYDLMHVKLWSSERIKSAWWNGIRWKGLHLKKGEVVIAWKRNLEHD
jgi:hypothetical protein